MKTSIVLGSLALAAVAGSANASISFSPSDWSYTLPSSRPAAAWITGNGPGSISLRYDDYQNYDMWYGPLMTQFSTSATQTGPVALDWHYALHHSWFRAYALLSFSVNGSVVSQPVNYVSTAGDYVLTGTVILNLNAGDTVTVSAGGLNYDASMHLFGTLTLTESPIPAPGSLALIGIAGLAGARRRRR